MTQRSIRAPLAWLGPGRLVDDARIVVERGVVVAAGPAAEIGETDDELRLDGFVMPAVADRHVHIGMSSPAEVLAGGVTAVRDLGWPPDLIFTLADASELPSFDGPLIRAAGPMLTAPGGYPTASSWAPPGTGREVKSPEDAAAAVEELARLGAAAIKVALNAEAGPTPSDAALAAICDAAHAADLPVAAHTQGKGEVERALGAGVDELAHTPWTPLSDQVIESAATRLRIVSTLDILSSGRDTPEIRTALDNLRRFHVAGGTIVYGTDLGNGETPPGIHTREAQLIREAGLELEEVLATMIRAPLEPDAPADLVALAASPLDDLAALSDVRTVIRAGGVVGR